MPMHDIRDEYIGKHIGRWSIKGKDKNNKLNVICQCDCGTIKSVDIYSIKNGKSKSCGCLVKEKMSTHGLTKTRLYRIWSDMKCRCYNKNNIRFNHYGGKGVVVCDKWKNDFKSFYDWSMDNGYSDDLTIDRIDVDGNYEPDNCRWVDFTTQANNTTKNVVIQIGNYKKTASQWAKEAGIRVDLLLKRYHSGIEGEELLKPPMFTKIHSAIIVEDNLGIHEFKTQEDAAKYLGIISGSIHKYVNNVCNPRRNIKIYRKGDV